MINKIIENDIHIYIPSNLKHLRLKNHLKQENIAKLVNKDRSLISQWESGTKEISINDLILLSAYFKLTIDEFVLNDLKSNNYY